jgi:DNA-binding transcriptional ArsR family regulator
MPGRSDSPATCHVADDIVEGETLERLTETFKALGDTTRVRMIYALLAQELCVRDIAAAAGISESAASHQLRHLRSLRLVKHRRQGQRMYYSLDDDHINALLGQCLEHAREPR